MFFSTLRGYSKIKLMNFFGGLVAPKDPLASLKHWHKLFGFIPQPQSSNNFFGVLVLPKYLSIALRSKKLPFAAQAQH